MVKDGKEFTLLQGYIGREYARASKESEDVAEAIYEHYLPRFSGDRLPAGTLGTLIAVADRLDTITGGFLLGFEPTGSQDPYALRRQALGLLRICIEQAIPVSLSAFVKQSIACYGEEGFPSSERTAADLAAMIHAFFTQRLNVMLRSRGFDYDLVGAVLAAPWDNPSTACLMVEELQGMRNGEQLVPFVLAMKRIINILPKDRRGGVTREGALRSLQAIADRQWTELEFSPELFTDRAEHELCESTVEVFGAFQRRSGKGTESAFKILSNLTPTVNRYFDEVLVNCEDEGLRNNRISFLTETYRAFSLACDFSLIVGEQMS
jgi:glycyl-tRNA synthetase beta chain